jgi:hypothetical protein
MQAQQLQLQASQAQQAVAQAEQTVARKQQEVETLHRVLDETPGPVNGCRFLFDRLVNLAARLGTTVE